MKEIYTKYIASVLNVRDWQVENCALMFEEGNTIPFISRYRKEKTGGLDDASVAEIKHWVDVFAEMEKRKSTVIQNIEAQGKLSDELRRTIENCVSVTELEDIYLPYRPKRRTRATAAREIGLEPLADSLMNTKVPDPEREAGKYVGEKVADVEAALSGARDIIAERLSESVQIRETLRGMFRNRRFVSRQTRQAKDNPEASRFRTYFDFSMPVRNIPSHNMLGMLRAENEGFVNISVDVLPEKCTNKIYYDWCQEHGYPPARQADQIRASIDDSYKRLLEPSILNEIIKEAKQKADEDSVKVFEDNLRQLLLSAPLGQKRIMAVDPGFRNGCKIACLDAQGQLLHHEIIFPHPPQNQKVKAMMSVGEMIEKYGIEAIAIGNGTASRETEEFFKKVHLPDGCRAWVVSEDGASIYSASEVARREFPDEDVTVRGAVSIGRRLMDPLSELVKIDPKSLGVGQYQHDVDQNLLKEKLDNTVEFCVNSVGVDLNTASPYLLSYVAGIGPALAENIVKYRSDNGVFGSRAELKKVPRLGAKAFEQCAGFLRIRDGRNPLDNSSVHPEAYHIVDRMAASLGVKTSELVGNADLCSKLTASDYVDDSFGIPTVNDIIKELAKPGRDPREAAQEFEFSADVHTLEDLFPGMELPGIVTNITNFGAFVDIGLHENGLIHVSQMGVRGLADPTKVLKLHQQIRVSVLQVDLDRKRISLRLVK
ncbi:MAG: RNA-binding transcriptional accessory protein [Bacteroidales bacterium]|nr:RNA-binding transcriptional accessory protein [Bacteroidales bacterium]